SRSCEWDDLIVVAVDEEYGLVDGFQIGGVVDLRKLPNTVIVRFDPALHALQPERLLKPFVNCSPCPVKPVKRHSQLPEKLRAVRGCALTNSVKRFYWGAFRVA